MNARILELIKNPENIQNQDLDLLNSELNKHPYLQNIRALHLIGTHVFNTADYQKQLSVTAAYTTDKKILYQLINKKSDVEKEAEVEVEEKKTSEIPITEEITEKSELKKSPFEEINYEPKPTAAPIFVKGELNRILFEGEEDFLERETEKIDVASILEAGKIVTHHKIQNTNVDSKPEETVDRSQIIKEESSVSDVSADEIEILQEEIQIERQPELPVGDDSFNKEKAETAETFSTETIINESKMDKEEAEIEDLSAISFHGLHEFLPDIKVNPTSAEEKYELPKPQVNKHELEMQRLIAEVEAKMKTSKKEKIQEKEIIENHDVNFSENQRSDVEASKDEMTSEKREPISESSLQKTQYEEKVEKDISTPVATEKAPWKPMSFSGNTPDSLLSENTVAEVKAEEKPAGIETISEQIKTERSEAREAFNVSFFTQEVSTFEPEIPQTIKDITEKKPQEETIIEDSNIPKFINTWQKWLKIERVEEEKENQPIIPVPEDKNTVIEKFIEKEPRISKLKEESDFVVKERGSNISHLMTETLANIYVQQKLYSKAIKAYEILIVKHPLKEEMFKIKIQEVKELRKNFNKENR